MTFQEEKTMDSPTLSPLAAPFHPTYEPVHLCIYNDGIPSMTLTSEADCNMILHGIQDEALDEGFPPDAHDAAELEAVETFVEMLATFALMEEREEKARNGFTFFKKRWEVRRANGLQGRPGPPKHWVDPVQHNGLGNNHANSDNAAALIVHNPEVAKMNHLTEKSRNRDMARRSAEHKQVHSNHHVARILIQQPRKQNS